MEPNEKSFKCKINFSYFNSKTGNFVVQAHFHVPCTFVSPGRMDDFIVSSFN
jgi:hypothetical protein